LARADHPKTQYLPFLASKCWQSPKQLAKNAKQNAQLTPFANMKMIPQNWSISMSRSADI
jgi:hypothetical protein